MTQDTPQKRTLSNRFVARVMPHRYLAAQLRRPSGLFGRVVLTRGLNDGNAGLIDATLDRLCLGREETFLDVGFGGGRALARAAEQTTGPLWGADFSPDMVREGHRSLAALVRAGRLNLITADVVQLPLRDGWVDALCTTNTIYFWADLPAALAELYRVLRPGGRVAFGYSGRAKMNEYDEITRHGFKTYEPADLEGPLSDAGFQTVTTRALSEGVTRGDFVTLAVRP